MILVSVLYGVLAVLIFRRLTEKSSVGRTVNRILAHVMELGLFIDSPSLVFRAQRDLVRENLRLLRLTILPGAILALLFALLYPPMNTMYGRAPLPIREPSVVTIQMKDAAMPAVQLEAPEGIIVETPAIRILHDHQISWRVRPLRPTTADFKFRLDNHSAIRSIEIPYPAARIAGLPWLAWFVLISSVS
ncbi:MAG TPA: hypothetical protein VNU44_03240, partial [Bryobacteraceae bacterium]|nr:hypothetical protein [Bryobacteraceae bacterium]